MLGRDVRDFVGYDRGNLVVGPRNLVESREDADLAAGHRKRVDLRDIKNDKFPIGIGHIPEHHLGNPVADALELLDAVFVTGNLVPPLHVVEHRDAHLRHFFVVDEVHRPPTGNRNLIAAGAEQDCEQGQDRGGHFHERRETETSTANGGVGKFQPPDATKPLLKRSLFTTNPFAIQGNPPMVRNARMHPQSERFQSFPRLTKAAGLRPSPGDF